MRRFLFAFLLSFVGGVHAYDCMPTAEATPLATGIGKVSVKSSAGEAAAWWCILPIRASTPPGKVEYGPQFFVVLDKYRNVGGFVAALGRIAASSTPFDTLNAEVKAATVTPVPGSQDEFEYLSLFFSACTQLKNTPSIFDHDPIPADWCGAAPVPPVPPVNTYAVAGPGASRAAFPIVNGKRSFSSSKQVAVGTSCDCSTKYIEGQNTFCAVAPALVAVCSRSTPATP